MRKNEAPRKNIMMLGCRPCADESLCQSTISARHCNPILRSIIMTTTIRRTTRKSRSMSEEQERTTETSPGRRRTRSSSAAPDASSATKKIETPSSSSSLSSSPGGRRRTRSLSADVSKKKAPPSSRQRSLSLDAQKASEEEEESSSPAGQRRTRSLSTTTDAAAAAAAAPPPPKSSSSTKKKKATRKSPRTNSKKSKKAKDPPPASQETAEEEDVAPPQKPEPVVDVIVHRLRHIQYLPSGIVCMAATKQASDNLLAVSRKSGSVELRSTDTALRTLCTVAGQSGTPWTVLAWNRNGDNDHHQETTLVGGSSADGSVGIIDFGRGVVTGRIPAGGGAVLALVSVSNGTVAAGCQDGAVRFFRVQQQQLVPVHTLRASPAHATLSLAVQRDRLWVGGADGTVRRYDADGPSLSYKSVLRMTLPTKGGSVPPRVWAVRALSDGTVISTDSTGHVLMWDGDTGVLQQSFVHSDSAAHVLAVAVTADERKVFCSGVDSRVVCIEKRRTTGDDGDCWVLTSAQRPHTHDVVAVATLSKQTSSGKTVELLCTGGVDTKICTYLTADFAKKRPKTLYPWPSPSPVAVAGKARLVTVLRDDHIDLYDLLDTMEEEERLQTLKSHPFVVPDKNTAKLATVQITGTSSNNLVCHAVSDDGRFVALSDASSVALFYLQQEKTTDRRALSPSRVVIQGVPSSVVVITSMHFVRGDCLILVSSNGTVHVVALQSAEYDENLQVDQSVQATVVQTLQSSAASRENEVGEMLPVHSTKSTASGRWFATARNCTRGDGRIGVFCQKDDSASFQLWWTLPTLETACTAINFLADEDPPLLAVGCANFAMYLFDVHDRRLSNWSEQAGYPVSRASLPAELAYRNDYPVRFAINPTSPSQFMMGSFGAIVAVDSAERFPVHCRIFPERHFRGRKRKRSLSAADQSGEIDDSASENETSCTLCLRYNSMLYMDFIDKNEMVIIEQPWLDIVATFPDALQRTVYGS